MQRSVSAFRGITSDVWLLLPPLHVMDIPSKHRDCVLHPSYRGLNVYGYDGNSFRCGGVVSGEDSKPGLMGSDFFTLSPPAQFTAGVAQY